MNPFRQTLPFSDPSPSPMKEASPALTEGGRGGLKVVSGGSLAVARSFVRGESDPCEITFRVPARPPAALVTDHSKLFL